jgi:hypothetical protein
MKFLKFYSIIVIVLIISISFSGNYLYAAQNNTEETNETLDNNTNNTDIIPRTTVNLPVYTNLDGLGGLDIKSEFMKRPIIGECGVWIPFKKGYDNRGKDRWYNLYHFWWHLAYPLTWIAEGIVFIIEMLAWFFASAAWCIYAIGEIVLHIPELITSIEQLALSFNPQSMRGIKSFNNPLPKICNYTENISTLDLVDNPFYSSFLNGTLNNTKILNATLNDTILTRTILCNETNMTDFVYSNSLSNSSDIYENTTLNDTILTRTILSNETNMTDFVYSNSLSNSFGIYENATTKQLEDTLTSLEKSRKGWTGSLTIIDNVFDGLATVFSLISLVCDIVSGVSAALSAPSSGGSVPAAVGSEVAKEGAKEGGGAAIENVLTDFVKSRAKDIAITTIHNIVDKCYLDNMVKKANGKENDTGNYATAFERRAMKIGDQVTSAIDKIFDGKKFKKTDIFGWIRSFVSVITSIGKLIVDLNFDGEEDLVQHELDFRSENNITI